LCFLEIIERKRNHEERKEKNTKTTDIASVFRVKTLCPLWLNKMITIKCIIPIAIEVDRYVKNKIETARV